MMKTNKPLVSVIIPAYNAEQFILRCLKSVYSQTFKNIEVIVINDGSKDKTQQILEEYKQDNPKLVLINKENGGVSSARNQGIEVAQGDYITFVDADDELLPNGIQNLVDGAQNYNADMVIGQYFREKEFKFEPIIWEGLQGVKNSLLDHPYTYTAWSKLYRKELFGDVYFVEGIRIHEDDLFVLMCLMKKPKVAIIDKSVYKINETVGSASRSAFSEKFLDILKVLEIKIDLISHNCPELIEMTKNTTIKAHLALLINLAKTNEKKYKGQKKESLKIIRKNKKYFRPATKKDKIYFFLFTHYLYSIFSILFRIKQRKNIKS